MLRMLWARAHLHNFKPLGSGRWCCPAVGHLNLTGNITVLTHFQPVFLISLIMVLVHQGNHLPKSKPESSEQTCSVCSRSLSFSRQQAPIQQAQITSGSAQPVATDSGILCSAWAHYSFVTRLRGKARQPQPQLHHWCNLVTDWRQKNIS